MRDMGWRVTEIWIVMSLLGKHYSCSSSDPVQMNSDVGTSGAIAELSLLDDLVDFSSVSMNRLTSDAQVHSAVGLPFRVNHVNRADFLPVTFLFYCHVAISDRRIPLITRY